MNVYDDIRNKLEGAGERDTGQKMEILARLCACNRINALGTIYHAGRGWIGASLSCAEILTALYFDIARMTDDKNARDAIVLGKGHAAAMQYACLAGCGIIPVSDLQKYEMPDGPQAHTDIATPGIDVNTGSMGQALSKCAGLAMADPHRRVFVVLGDGELQEGQNYEALASIRHRNLENLVVIVDRNRIQTDSNVDDIKSIHDLEGIFKGFGLNVHVAKGNDIAAVHRAIVSAVNEKGPSAVIAETEKGAGISFMSSGDAKRRSYNWHSGVPTRTEYIEALKELCERVGSPELNARLGDFMGCEELDASSSRVSSRKSGEASTGVAFGAEIVRLAAERSDIHVFDADLEKSCHLTEFAEKYPDRFVEMGIAEQDMCSCAGGFALRGKLPVVNTYAAFFRRAYEQIYANATEHTKIIYAGHYAGLCYSPDGKSHQCTGDVAMMRAIPGMTVLYPAFVEEIGGMLDWYLDEGASGPLYIRLHRLPMEGDVSLPPSIVFRKGEGVQVRENGASDVIVTAGPHMTRNCAVAADELKAKHGLSFDVYSISTLTGLKAEFAGMLAKTYRTIHVIEETIAAGGLFDELCRSLAGLKLNDWPRLRSHAVNNFTFSTLDPFGLYKHFNLDPDGICNQLHPGGAIG